MAKQVILGVLGVVLGIVAGMAFMMSLHLASTLQAWKTDLTDLTRIQAISQSSE